MIECHELELQLVLYQIEATKRCSFVMCVLFRCMQPENWNIQVSKIREQSQKQEETIKEQEGELDSKRSELQKLKDEESSLEKEYDDNKNKLERLSKSLQDTQLQISQVNLSFCIRIHNILIIQVWIFFS